MNYYYYFFFEKASAAVRSPYTLKEHCKSTLKLVEPVHHVLGSESGHKIGTYSFVPITKVLTIAHMRTYLMEFRPTDLRPEIQTI